MLGIGLEGAVTQNEVVQNGSNRLFIPFVWPCCRKPQRKFKRADREIVGNGKWSAERSLSNWTTLESYGIRFDVLRGNQFNIRPGQQAGRSTHQYADVVLVGRRSFNSHETMVTSHARIDLQ